MQIMLLLSIRRTVNSASANINLSFLWKFVWSMASITAVYRVKIYRAAFALFILVETRIS